MVICRYIATFLMVIKCCTYRQPLAFAATPFLSICCRKTYNKNTCVLSNSGSIDDWHNLKRGHLLNHYQIQLYHWYCDLFLIFNGECRRCKKTAYVSFGAIFFISISLFRMFRCMFCENPGQYIQLESRDIVIW